MDTEPIHGFCTKVTNVPLKSLKNSVITVVSGSYTIHARIQKVLSEGVQYSQENISEKLTSTGIL